MGKKHRAKKNNAGRRRAERVGGSSAPRPAPRRPERFLIATHEAGHGVACLMLFGDVACVEISPDNTGGRTVGTSPLVPPGATRADIEAAMLFVFAGYAAECVYAKNRRGFGLGMAGDAAHARRLAAMGAFTEAEVTRIFQAAIDFVEYHEVEIVAVTDQLKRCGKLLGPKFAQIAQAARTCAQVV